MTRDYSGSFDELTDAACLLNYCYEEGLRTTVKLKLPVLAANSPAVEPPRASSRCLVSRAMFFWISLFSYRSRLGPTPLRLTLQDQGANCGML